jgi:hypothetical protein
MSTISIVVVAVWNALLLAALAAVVGRRKRVFRWVTGLDRQSWNRWDRSDHEAWSVFLAEHPELLPGGGEDSLAAADRSAALSASLLSRRGTSSVARLRAPTKSDRPS